MSLLDVATSYYLTQQALTRAAQDATQRQWHTVQPADLDGWWAGLADKLMVTVAAAQLLAAQQADPYLDETLAEQDGGTASSGAVVARALAGVASDGRGLDSLLYMAVIRVKQALSLSLPMPQALARGEATLLRIVGAQVQDAGRVATSVAVTARPQVQGWVRMIRSPACARCVVLAGKWFRWNAGFSRHPGCNCVHIPSTEDDPDDLRTDPKAYFESLSKADQDKYFTGAGAQAIRDGADLNQVVNARRGAAGLSQPGRLTDAEQATLKSGGAGKLARVDVYGQQVATTTEGTTVRGLAGQRLAQQAGASRQPGQRLRTANTPRLMPEAIADIAGGDRAERLRLLHRFGYII